MIVPFREAPVLAATLNPTEPFPVPAAPDVTVIHTALLTAVHAQAAVVVTFSVPVLAAAGAFRLVGASEYVHAGGGAVAAACDTVYVRLLIAIVPVRAAPVLAATTNVTMPSPAPVAPDVSVIQGTLLAADQVQLPATRTLIGVPGPPDAPMFSPVGEMLASQDGGGAAADWVTVARCPATVIVLVR